MNVFYICNTKFEDLNYSNKCIYKYYFQFHLCCTWIPFSHLVSAFSPSISAPFLQFQRAKNSDMDYIACRLDTRSRVEFWKNDRAAVRAVRTIQYNNLSWKTVKTASQISGNHPFLGPVNFLRDASHPLITALCFRHSQTLFSSTPKMSVALRFPFSSVYWITSRLNFAIYDSLLGFWHPSSITTVHNELE